MDVLENIKREPVLISVLGGNILALLVAFGVDLSQEQTAAVMALVTTLTAFAFGRSAVTPNRDVAVVLKGGGLIAADAAPMENGTPVDIWVEEPGEEGTQFPPSQ